MSFLSDITDTASKFFGGNSAGSSILRTVLTGYALNQFSKNTIKSNDIRSQTNNIDAGVRLQIPPAADKHIPVLYGTAYFGGIITEAQMSNNNKTMHYVLTLSEKTGTLLSTTSASAYTFKYIYWNDQRIVFKADGLTVDYTVDVNGNIDRSLSELVKVYCFAGNSSTPQVPETYTNGSLLPAYSIVPTWTSSYTMSDLIFAVVRVDYSKDRNVTGIGNMNFQIQNSMVKPGDVLYDYMTNTRYGAGIPAGEIYSA